MKNKKRTVKTFISALVFAVLLLTVFVTAAKDGYSTEDDPLVALSYINDVVEPSLRAYVDGKTNGATAEEIAAALLENEGFVQMISDMIDEKAGESIVKSYNNADFDTLKLNAGAKIIASGRCEIIVRSGKCSAVSGTPGAVRDISADRTLENGQEIPQGDLVEVLYGNDSGVYVLRANTEILIRGEYTVGK